MDMAPWKRLFSHPKHEKMAKIAQLVIPVSSTSHGDLHPPIEGAHRQLDDLSSWATILISILPLFEGLRFREFQTFLSYFLAS